MPDAHPPTDAVARVRSAAAADTAQRTLWGVGTSRTLRAQRALIELGLPYRTELIRTRTAAMQSHDFARLNPRQKIPVLTDGDILMPPGPEWALRYERPLPPVSRSHRDRVTARDGYRRALAVNDAP